MLGFCSLASPSYVLTSPPTILPHAQRLSLLRMQVTDVPSPTDHKFSVNPTPGPTWSGETGTSFLPEEAVERAAEGNPIEKAKLAKDATAAFNDVYAFAAAIRASDSAQPCMR